MNALENESDDDDDAEDRNVEEELTPQRDDAIITFSSHEGPVFCGSFHPTLNVAVTGGEDDKAYVWSTETGNVVFAVTGHKDSVIAAEFSADGNFLVTGDMAGYIQVFKTTQDYKKVWEFEMGDMGWLQWHIAANVLFAGSDTGETYVWRIPSGDCKVLQGNGSKAEIGQLTADGKSLIVGYSDGCVKLWDIKSSTVVQNYEENTPLGHSGSITSIAADPENGRFLTGSEDGKIMIANNTGPLHNLFPNSGSVEAIAYSLERDEMKLVACGTLEGKISLWDVNRQAIRMECPNPDPTGITKLIWAPNHTLLCATLDGSIRIFDGRNGQRKVCDANQLFDVFCLFNFGFCYLFQLQLEGHVAEVYDIKYKKSTNEVLTTSEDKTAKIFKFDLWSLFFADPFILNWTVHKRLN